MNDNHNLQIANHSILYEAIQSTYPLPQSVVDEQSPLPPLLAILLFSGIDVSMQSTEIDCPLCLAASLGGTQVISELITNFGFAVSQSVLDMALLRALSGHHKDTVQLLLHLGASPVLSLDESDYPCQVLHNHGMRMAAACLLGNLEMLCTEWIKVRNSEINCYLLANHPIQHPESVKETLLQYALSARQHEIIDYLLCELGCDPNYSYDGCHLPLFDAVINGDTIAVRSLLKHGANVNIYDDVGWTPLMYAVHLKHIDIAICLLEYGANYSAVQKCHQLRNHEFEVLAEVSCLGHFFFFMFLIIIFLRSDEWFIYYHK